MVERVKRTRLFRGFNSIDKISPSTEIFDSELVKRDLLNHFHTSRGERVMRPNFGSIIWDLLFEPFDNIIREEVVADVETIIGFDSRVTLQQVDVVEFEHGLRINVALLYHPLEAIGLFEIEFDRRNQIGRAELSGDLL